MLNPIFVNFSTHHTQSMPISSPTSLVNLAAASTSRIKLGTAVSVLSTDEPIRVFQQLSTAAAIAPGRIEMVAGRGSSDITFSLNTLRNRGIKLERTQEVNADALAQVEFSVPNMVCEGCAGTISTALQGLPGVQQVKPKIAQKHVYVSYEPAKVGQQQLKKALLDSGFTAIEV
jgi:copper chaperone CopZ